MCNHYRADPAWRLRTGEFSQLKIPLFDSERARPNTQEHLYPGRTGEIVKSLPRENRVIVQGINMIKRHTKPGRTDAGGIIEREAAIHVSNVAILDPKTDKPAKIGFKFLEDGRKVRIARGSGETLDR